MTCKYLMDCRQYRRCGHNWHKGSIPPYCPFNDEGISEAGNKCPAYQESFIILRNDLTAKEEEIDG